MLIAAQDLWSTSVATRLLLHSVVYMFAASKTFRSLGLSTPEDDDRSTT